MEELLTLHAAADAIRDGRATPLALLEACLAKIDRLEDQLHAWVFVDREGARLQAERATAEIRAGRPRGPLHGIPLGIKDIFDVADWPTAAGSRRWANSIARYDSAAVARLRQAGAVFVGKTVTTAFASFDPPPTVNPWDPTRTPGGSSSGSAAAVATGMCLGALGSQTGGSITRPATYCGVAGCKPTYGRVSLAGVVPLAGSMDHVGPIAPSVRDLALLLQVIAGHDPADPTSRCRPVPSYTAGLERRSAPRIGLIRGMFEHLAGPEVREMMGSVVATLDRAGAVVVERSLPVGFEEVIERHRKVMAVEALHFHRERLERHPEDYPPCIGQLLGEGKECSAVEYARCKEHQRQLRHDMRACFFGLDALLTPATTGPAPDRSTTGSPAFNSPWSYTRLPTVSFPTATAGDGLPLGIQLVGAAWAEAELLAVAGWCESHVGLSHLPG